MAVSITAGPFSSANATSVTSVSVPAGFVLVMVVLTSGSTGRYLTDILFGATSISALGGTKIAGGKLDSVAGWGSIDCEIWGVELASAFSGTVSITRTEYPYAIISVLGVSSSDIGQTIGLTSDGANMSANFSSAESGSLLFAARAGYRLNGTPVAGSGTTEIRGYYNLGTYRSTNAVSGPTTLTTTGQTTSPSYFCGVEIQEASSGTTYTEPLAESVGVSEANAVTTAAAVALAEAVASVEDLLAQRLTFAELVDSLGITEEQTAGLVFTTLLAETVASDGNVAAVLAAIATAAESVGVSESVSSGGTTTYEIALEDGTTLSEQASTAVRALAEVVDSAAFSDAIANAAAMSDAVAEQLGLSEEQTTRLSQTLALAEQIASVEGLTGGLSFAADVFEQCESTSSVVAGFSARQGIVDNATVQGAVTAFLAAAAELEDALSAAGDIAAGRFESVELLDAVAIADAALAAQSAIATLNDAVASASVVVADGGVAPDVSNNLVRAMVFASRIPAIAATIESIPAITVYPIV